MSDLPKLAMSMSWTVQVEQFSPLNLFLSISDVDADTPAESIAALMDSRVPEIADHLQKGLMAQMNAKLAALRGEEPPPKPLERKFTIFGHAIEAEFPKSVNWRSPMTDGLKAALRTEWKRFGLTMTQIFACEKAILKEAGETMPDTGLLAGQAWIITKFLKETQSKRDPVNAMLIAADVSELEKPIEGEELAKEAADIFA